MEQSPEATRISVIEACNSTRAVIDANLHRIRWQAGIPASELCDISVKIPSDGEANQGVGEEPVQVYSLMPGEAYIFLPSPDGRDRIYEIMDGGQCINVHQYSAKNVIEERHTIEDTGEGYAELNDLHGILFDCNDALSIKA